MRPSQVSIVGATLAFDRSGARLLVAEPTGVVVVELATYVSECLPYRHVRALAAFDEQIWLATADDQLIRIDRSGHELGAPVALPFAPTTLLLPAACGPAAAVWAADPPCALVDDGGALHSGALEGAELAIPLAGRRCVIARGARLTLPSGMSVQLAPQSHVLGGAVSADGKAVTILVSERGALHLTQIALGTARVTFRCAAPTSAVRVASRASIAVARIDATTLWLVDLNARRELGTVALAAAIADHAIDPAGERIAVRSATGEIELLDVAALLAGPSQAQGSGGNPAVEPIADEPVAVDEVSLADESSLDAASRADASAAPPEPIAERAPLACPPLLALEPRPHRPPPDRALARTLLDRELRSVALWTLRAIAAAWDTRRLGYGNEGKHPYEHEVAAILGMGGAAAPEYVAAARDALLAHERELRADAAWRAPNTPIGELMAEFGLDHRAIDILITVAAASLWGEAARLYGILANDPGRAIADELLVQQVLGGHHDRHDLAAELDARAPLIRLGILQVAARRSRPFAALTVDSVILDRLRAIPPELGIATAVRAEIVPLDALDAPRAVLAAAIAALAQPSPSPVRIVARGRIGTGRRTAITALAGAAGRATAVIDAASLPRGPLFDAELRRSLRRSHLAGLIPCVVGLAGAGFDERTGSELAAEALREHPGPVAMTAAHDEPTPFAAGHVAIDLPILPESERAALWRSALAAAGLHASNVDAIAARYKLGPGIVRQAIAAARAETADAAPAIEAYIRQTRDARLAQHARRVERLASWSSIVLPPDIADSLRELIARVRHGRTVFETWGMQRTMATSRGLTALFQGQPGTGKTLVAGVIARELGLELYQVDLSKIMSKWIGETERNLSTIFDAAEDGQVILLFDEADSLFAKRTEVRSSNDRYANLEVNYLLQRLDSFEGIAILTTNNGTSIDAAFKRRMSFRMTFPFPDDETREELWRVHLPPELPIAGPLALDQLARKYQLSGGYIRNACLRAAFLAAQDDSALTQRHLERAVALELAEVGRLSDGGAIE